MYENYVSCPSNAVTVYLFIMSYMIFLVSMNLTGYVQCTLCVDSLVDILLHQFGFLTAVLIVLFFIWSVCLSVSTHYCVNKDYQITISSMLQPGHFMKRLIWKTLNDAFCSSIFPVSRRAFFYVYTCMCVTSFQQFYCFWFSFYSVILVVCFVPFVGVIADCFFD